MKKLLTFIVGSALGLGAYAQDFDSGDLRYSVLSPDDKTCAVIGYNSLGSELEIPSTVDYEGEEYTVTEISGWAFGYQRTSKLILPSTLEIIGDYAFYNWDQLEEVVIPNSVKEIGQANFAYSWNLKNVELGSALELIKSDAFRESPIQKVVALGTTPARFETEFSNSFTNNPFIAVNEEDVAAYKAAWKGAFVVPNIDAESIAFDPDRTTVMPGGTVQLNCVVTPANAPVKFTSNDLNLYTVDENGLVTAEILNGWSSLVHATTLNGLTASCYITNEYLEQFTAEGFTYAILPNVQNEAGVVNYDTEAGNIANIPSTVEYDGVSYTVTRIASMVGAWRDGIEEVVVPASVKYIGGECFRSCYSLKKVTIEDSKTPLVLSRYAFTNNQNLAELYVGRNVVYEYSDNQAAFWWNDKLTHLVLGPEVTSIPTGAFRECYNLNLIESKNLVPPVLGENAFGWRNPSIIVPAASVEAYQLAWEQYASGIAAAVEAESISFEDEEVTIYNGQRIKLPLIIDPEDAQVLWTSSNPNLVSVDAEGNIEYGYWTREVGEAIITATSLNGLTAECKVTAKPWLTLSENELNMTPGSTAKVEVTKAEELADAEIEWRSDNENVATVDENGNITAVSYGETNIQAEVYVPSINSWISYSVWVVVRNVPTSVSVENPEVTVFKDYDTYFDVAIEPQDDAYLNRQITWTVADPEIAEVDYQYGSSYSYCRVIGKEVGKTVLTGETVNGLTVEVELTVLPRIENLTFATNATYMAEGQTRQLEFTTDPEETYQTYKYTSGDENIVTIDENGVMTAHSLGETYVFVEFKTPWGTNSRSHRVNVVIAPENVEFVDGISDYEAGIGRWIWFNLEFTPDNSEVSRHIDWTAEDPEVVNIDSNDNSFYGLKFGTSAFRGVAVNGQVLEGTITIAGINVLVDGNHIGYREMSVGDEFKFDIEASSAELLANVTVESSNPDVVTVTEDGTVTAVGYGRAYINVRSWEETAKGRKDYDYSVEILVRPEEGFVFSTPKATLMPWYSEYLNIITAPNLSVWDLDLTWETSDDNVAYVGYYGQDYAYIYYAGPGQASISATDLNGNGSATCDVTCYGIAMSEGYVVMDTNSTYQLQAIVTPDAEGVEFEWFSYDNDLVSVDENGLLTSYGVSGYVTVGVRAILNGRDMYAYCGVEVYPQVYVPVEDVLLDEPFISEAPGTYYQLTATINPEDATNKALIWTSEDESVATVDQDGLVYIVSYGFTLIHVTSVENPDASAMCLVIGGTSGVNGLFEVGDCDIYDLNGIVVKKSATVEDYNQLAPGIYLIRKGDAVIKIKR